MKSRIVSAALVVLALSAAYGYSERLAIVHALAQLRLIPLEESVTELYFSNTDTLPVRNTGSLTFSFTIHNLEGRDMVYPYIVSAQFQNGESVVLDTNTIPIASGDVATIDESLTVRSSGTAALIVTLPEQGEHIQFLLK